VAVLAVGVIVAVAVWAIVLMPVMLGHRLKQPKSQSEMTMRSRVGMAVHTRAMEVSVWIERQGDHV
jgi:hypothetical protein